MPKRKPPTRSRHRTALSLLQYEHTDLAKRFTFQERALDEVRDALLKHRKEEKDNGKRIDALTRVVESLVAEIRKGRKA